MIEEIMRAGERRPPRVILVPFPAQGHVTPMLHLAQAVLAQGLDATVACPDFIHRRLVARLDVLPADDPSCTIRFASLESGLLAAEDGGADDDAAPKDFPVIVQAMESHMPAHLERLLRSHSDGRVSLLVVDLLASWAIPVARRLGIPVAGFWPAMLATYRLIEAIPKLIQRGLISECGTPVYNQSHYDQDDQMAEELIKLQGQAKLSTKHLPWLVGDSDSQKTRFMFWLRTLGRAKSLQWLLINSFPGEEGELDDAQALQQPLMEDGPSILQIGPLMAYINTTHQLSVRRHNLNIKDEDLSCLEWLDQHPPNSVVYVSFGSWVAPLSSDKMTELALGLEAARHPFLWVLPAGDGGSGWRARIPAGYLDRVAGHAKVVAWAPQQEVLKHQAIRCYITHCGWNSTLEAIQYGKPLLCYPVAGDQFVNCAYIVKVWGIGITSDETSRTALQKAIENIMKGGEGKKIKKRLLELKKKVMGHMGTSKAMANLQSFLNEVHKSI